MNHPQLDGRDQRKDSPGSSVLSEIGLILARLRTGLRSAARRILGRLRAVDHTIVILTAMAIGVLGGYGAIAFRLLIGWSHRLFFSTTEYSLTLLESLPWWQRLILPCIGGLLVGLVTRLAPEVKGSGIPEVMEAVARRGGMIRFRVLVTKALAAALTIGSGGSAGREGPIIHIGSAIGSAAGQFFEVSAARLRTYVGCGAAAAIAATFNAPIAGALFSMEIVLGDLAVGSLSPIVISSVVATFISRHHLGDFPAFQVPAYEVAHPGELLFYAGLGLAAGVCAVGFIRLLYSTSDAFDASALPGWLRPAVGGLGVGVISLWLPHVYGVGYETTNAALWGRAPATLLLLLLVAKAAATSLTLGSGGSGGVFAPSLFMGASLGAAWGRFIGDLAPGWTAAPGAYALVGMGAVVSATTHAPITAILIIFELTNDYRIIPPLMLACVVGVLVSGFLNRESIYTAKLSRRGVRLRAGRDVNLLRGISVREVMDSDATTVGEALPFGKVLPMLLADPRSEVTVVNGSGGLVGSLSLNDVRSVLPNSDLLSTLAVVADAMHETVPFVLPSDHLDLVMHHLGRSHREQIPVCEDPKNRRVIGVVSRDAVIDAYNKRIFHHDLPGSFGSLVEAVQEGRTVEVLAGIVLREIEAPFSLVGRTLHEADLRRRFGVEVVLIHTPVESPESLEGRPGKLPKPTSRLEPGDRLLVMGTAEAIRSLQDGEEERNDG